jgi:hypothetical protein
MCFTATNASHSFVGYVQYIRPGVDSNPLPNVGSYEYIYGDNGFYLERDDGVEIGTVWIESEVNINTNTISQIFAMNSIGLTKNYMEPPDTNIQIKSILFKSTKKLGGSTFLSDQSLPNTEKLSDSSNLDYEFTILYFNTASGAEDLVAYTVSNVINCATYCNNMNILTSTPSPSPSQTSTPSPTPSASCPSWPVNKVRVCFQGIDLSTLTEIFGYFQYNKPGTDLNSNSDHGDYIFNSGDNGIYVVKNESTIMYTNWTKGITHIIVAMHVEDFLLNTINHIIMEPQDPETKVYNIVFHANRNPDSSEIIFATDELPSTSLFSHPDLIFHVGITYYNTTSLEYYNELYQILSIIDCSTYCPPVSFPSSTPTPSPIPSTSCIPPPANRKKHCITGLTNYGKTFTGYYKFDTNTVDQNGSPLVGEYPHNPLGYCYMYLEDQDGQVIETNPSVKMIAVGVLAHPSNQLDIASNHNIESPDIPGETTKNININYMKTNSNPATILATDAIPPTPLPLTDYAGSIRIYYEFDSAPGTTYLRTWVINTIVECNEMCPSRRLLEVKPSYHSYLRNRNSK